ncbi:MAG TPA: MFS transporter [Thermoplasmata archaeon]|nr:MFS transporter [Thermoplasmata archaeon]
MSSTVAPLRSAPANGRNGEYDQAYAWRVMWILAGLVTVVLYIEGMLTPSLPTIARDFGVSAGQASLILSSYIVTGVALSPVVGKLGDIYGKKRVLGIVLVVYAGCVSVTGFSPTFSFMVAARAFQGIGLTVFPLGMSLVREEFPREMVPRAQGILSGMFGAGFAVSLPIGAWVSFRYGWRVTYHSAIPFVILLAVLVFLFVRESRYRRPETRIDYVGASVLGFALALLVLALSEGPTWGWLVPATLTLFLLGALLLVPLVLYERRYQRGGGEAILSFRLLKERNVMVTNLVGSVSGLGMYLALLSMTYLFQDPVRAGGYGQTILGAGLSLVPLALGMLVFAPIAGAIVSRVGARPLTAVGSAVAGVAFLAAIPTQSLGSLLVVEFFVGAGIGILNAGMINLLVLTVDPRDMGLATSMSAVFRNIGSSVGAPLSGSILTTFTIVFLGFVFPAHLAFEWSFAFAAIAFACAGVVVYFGREVLGRGQPVLEVEGQGSAAIPSSPSH